MSLIHRVLFVSIAFANALKNSPLHILRTKRDFHSSTPHFCKNMNQEILQSGSGPNDTADSMYENRILHVDT